MKRKSDTNVKSENKKWPQYLATFTCVLCMISSGIHTGWPSPSLPILLSKNHPLHLSSEEASYVTIIVVIGDIIGTTVFPALCNTIGRKKSILLIAGPQICSLLMLFFSSYSKFVLYGARIIGGVSRVSCFSILGLYIGEIAEPKIRGRLLSLIHIFLILGILFINIVGSSTSIETASLISLVFPLLFLTTFSFMPESPYYFLMKKRKDDARQVLKILRHSNNVEEELNEIERDVERQMSERGRYKDLILIRSNRKSVLIMATIVVIMMFSGVPFLNSYGQIFFTKCVSFLSKALVALLWTLSGLISSTASYFLVDYLGRTVLLLTTLAVSGFCWTLTSTYFFLLDYSSLCLEQFDWIPFASILIFHFSFGAGIGTTFFCLSGEVFSTSVKTKAVCALGVVFTLFEALAIKITQILFDHYSLGVTTTCFAVCQWAGLVFCWMFLQETKGRTLEEIQVQIKSG